MHISDFLEKFKHYGSTSAARRETVAEFFSDVYKIPFIKEEISIKNGIISIKTSPAIKNDIFIRRESFLEILKQKLPDVYLVDIR